MKSLILNFFVFIIETLFISPIIVAAQPPNAFISHASQQSEFKENEKIQAHERARFISRSQSEFEQWKDDNDKQFNAFKSSIIKEWDEYISSSSKRWVEFGKDVKSCSIVDFDKGTVTIEVLAKPMDTAGNEVKIKLARTIKRVLTSKGTIFQIPLEQRDSDYYALSKPILANQVVTENGAAVSPKNVTAFADSIVENSTITTDSLSDTNELYKLTFPLAPNHLARRMAPYLPIVKKYCIKYDLNPAHVLAIIHTESYFNPMARSSENAIGLMQLVPEKGARQAWQFINNVDTAIPRAEYLYDPKTNIELGCAYLYILKNRIFGDVINTDCRLYCSIAGYNTGSGNVAYAFVGERKLAPAIQAINSINDADRVYYELVHKLPFVETRYYLENVIERVHLYQ
jgi:membrane-bound lytic murein transglycosylase C